MLEGPDISKRAMDVFLGAAQKLIEDGKLTPFAVGTALTAAGVALLSEACEPAEAAQIFRKVGRKGFERDGDRSAEFKAAAEPLVRIGKLLEDLLGKFSAMDRADPDLNTRFEQDRKAFSAQFEVLYGDKI